MTWYAWLFGLLIVGWLAMLMVDHIRAFHRRREVRELEALDARQRELDTIHQLKEAQDQMHADFERGSSGDY
jgi:hypothetical protein